MRILLPISAALLLSAAPGQAQDMSGAKSFCSDVPAYALSSDEFPFIERSGDNPSISQSFAASQCIEQIIMPESSAPSGPSTLQAMSDAPLSLQQTGLNTVNLFSSDQPVSNLTQRFSGTQTIHNSIVAGALGALTTISQSGVNTANTIEGTTIELAVQVMETGALQAVDNSLQIGGSIASISQAGDNIANIARAEYAIGVGVQEIGSESAQIVTNRLDLAAGSNIADHIHQSGTNVGNMLIADTVDSVIRRFDGTQVVDNTVILNDGHRPHITQSGNNIANFILAQSVGTISQISTGTQRVYNSVRGPDGREIRHANFEQSQSNYMGASNVVNLMIVGSRNAGQDNDEMEISQQAEFSQTANGTGGQSQSGNVLVINR